VIDSDPATIHGNGGAYIPVPPPWQGGGVTAEPRLHRVPTAIAELLAALVLAGLAWWCWQRGVIVTVRRGIEMNRVEGRWWALAAGLVTLAGILLLDAGRRTMVKAS
jgi:hypothetical protein